MRPVDLTPFPNELAVRWDDGAEQFIRLETLRRYCPCAACLGEQDIFGNTYKPPERPYTAKAFEALVAGTIIYLALCLAIAAVMAHVERRVAIPGMIGRVPTGGV